MSLRGKKDFDSVFLHGTKSRAGGLTVISAPGPSPTPRVGLIVGRAVGGAVERNRVKRRLRAALAGTPLAGRRDYVVVASGDMEGVAFSRLSAWLAEATGSSG